MHRQAARLGVVLAATTAAAVVAVALAFTASAQQPQYQTPGVLGSARGPAPIPARKVDLRALPDVTSADIAARLRIGIGPLTGTSASVYAARRGSAGSGRWAGPAANSTGSAPPPPTGNPQIDFAGNTERECGNAAPADQALAIGDKSQILQINQDCLSVWSAAGKRLLGPKTLQAFADLPHGRYVFDPRALYDWYNHRFILAFGDSDLTNNGYYNIAVSQNDDPAGKWNHYRFLTPSQNRVFNDFLRMGQDRQGVYLASNLFPMQGSCCGPYLWEEWVLLPKSLLYAGQPLSYWYTYGSNVNGVYTDSTQPANVWSPYDNPRAEFLLGSLNINFGGGNCVSGCGGLVVWALSDQFGWLRGSLYPPETSGYCCAGSISYFLPPQAGQPGTPNSIDTLAHISQTG
jgi:hypothetical protein